MARVCVLDSVSSGFAGTLKNGTAHRGRLVVVSRVIFSGARFENPAFWRNNALSFKPRIWRRRGSFSLQECTFDGCSYRLISALDDTSAESNCSANYGNGKAAYDILDYASYEEPAPAPADRSISDPTCGESSSSSTSSGDDVKRVSAEMAESALNSSEAWADIEYSSRRSSDDSGRDSYSSSSDKAVYLASGDYNGTGKPLATAVESNASPFDGGQPNERFFLESEKPAYVSLVWEAGAKIKGVTSDARQEGIVSQDHALSLIVDEEYRARKKLMQLEEILSSFPKSEEDLNPREAELLAYADNLLTQAKINQEAYVNSRRALSSAEEMVLALQSQVDELKEEVASRDNLLKLLKKEGIVSSQSLQRAAESLSEAEMKIIELENRVHVDEEIILKEREKLSAVRKTAFLHENAMRVSEQKAAELAKELASLKESLASARGAELSQQVKALEHELRSRDLLLQEIKEETIRSTDALKLAAKIKQDLNATRQRELQLTQSLEASHQKVKELEEQLTRNVRATRAEEVLKHTQKMLTEAKAEVDFLRQGFGARDEAIRIMKDEVDNNITLLSSAAKDREELRNMNRYVGELKMELESREMKLSMMREEMALIINLARKQQSSSHSPSRPESVSSTAPLSPPAPESKPRKKTSVRKSRETGTSCTVRKPNVRRRTGTPPQTS